MKLLIADDDKIIREMLRDILQALFPNINIIVAYDGQDAMNKISADIDYAIIDWVMPRQCGGTIVERLRDLNPGVKIVVISGYNIKDIVPKDIDKFIAKPIDLNDLSLIFESMHVKSKAGGT